MSLCWSAPCGAGGAGGEFYSSGRCRGIVLDDLVEEDGTIEEDFDF